MQQLVEDFIICCKINNIHKSMVRMQNNANNVYTEKGDYIFKKTIKHELQKLLLKLDNCLTRFEDFPEESLGWIRNPFHFNINEIKLGNLKISEELIDLSSDENLRIRFQENVRDTF